MINKIKLLVLSVLAMSLFVAPVAVSAATTSTDIQNGLCSGADLKFGSTSCSASQADESKQLNNLISKIINIVSVIVAVVAVVMIIVGGFKYITSGGDSSNVTGAKNTILYAIIGLVIVALAQFIVKFVLNTSNSVVK